MPQEPTELNITDLVPDATAGDVTALGGTMDLATFDHRLPVWLDRLYGTSPLLLMPGRYSHSDAMEILTGKS